MDVKEAVSAAKAYVRDTFSDDSIINLGLEEIEYDSDEREWLVTIGFSRPWDRPKPPLISPVVRWAEAGPPPEALNREYRVVRVKDDGTIASVRLRNVAA